MRVRTTPPTHNIDGILDLIDDATRPPMPEQYELDYQPPYVSRKRLPADDQDRATQLELETAFIEKTGPRDYERPEYLAADQLPEPMRTWALMPEPGLDLFGGPARVEEGAVDPDDAEQVERYQPTPPARIRPYDRTAQIRRSPRYTPPASPRPTLADRQAARYSRRMQAELVQQHVPLPGWNLSNLPRPVEDRFVDRGYRADDRDRRIVRLLEESLLSMNARQIAARMNITVGQARHSLWRLENEGRIRKIRRGWWTSV